MIKEGDTASDFNMPTDGGGVEDLVTGRVGVAVKTFLASVQAQNRV